MRACTVRVEKCELCPFRTRDCGHGGGFDYCTHEGAPKGYGSVIPVEYPRAGQGPSTDKQQFPDFCPLSGPKEGSDLSPKRHNLKTWPQFFPKIKSGDKSFEIRLNDRDFAVGDTLVLEEFDPETESYTGNTIERVVTYITDFKQQPGMVVMGVR